MAYLNFSELQGSPVATPADVVVRTTASGFSALEWSVVAIAQRDRLSSLREPSRIALALSVVLRDVAKPKLADPKLEALRRVSVHAWHRGYAVPPSEIRGFHAAGYTAEQYETLLASISRGRAALNQRNRHEYALAD
ncbi:MAG: hypothetical protein WDN44_10995 [Sphingomonas sp.]